MSDKKSASIILENGTIVTPTAIFKGSVAIKDGIIDTISQDSLNSFSPGRKIDCSGLLILPGVIDPHVHFGIPMRTATALDNLEIGTRAAAFGGITTIIDYINPSRTQSPLHIVSKTIQEASNAYIDYSYHCSIVSDREEVLSEIPKLIELGIPSFKLFFTYENLMLEKEQLDRVISQLSEKNALAQFHCELDKHLASNIEGYIKDGKGEAINHAKSRPNIAEVEAIDQALKITSKHNVPIYVVHLSSGAGLERLRLAKKERENVYVETCPHYLLLNDQLMENDENGSLFIMSPPLRKKEDNEILWEGVLDGTINVIATDHVVFSREQKGGKPFWDVPNGVMGVETTLPLIYTEGVIKRGLPLEKMVQLLSFNAAKILGLPQKGLIAEGKDADIVVFDPTQKWSLVPQELHMGSDYSIFNEFEVSGRAKYTISRGNIVIDNYQLVSSPKGLFVPRSL